MRGEAQQGGSGEEEDSGDNDDNKGSMGERETKRDMESTGKQQRSRG